MWTTHKFKIMIGAVVEVNLIASFQPNPEKASIEFYAAAGIKHAIGISVGNVAELIDTLPAVTPLRATLKLSSPPFRTAKTRTGPVD